MNIERGVILGNTADAVDRVIKVVGKDIRFAMPTALGKPFLFVNELYKRAKKDPEIKLKILSAISLERPAGKSELECRLVGPMAERIFGGAPQLEYMVDLRRGKLPENVEVYEFYSKAGAYMNDPVPQFNHLSANYTHVVRDAYYTMGVNVFGQMVSCKNINGELMLSMSCNTDIGIMANRLGLEAFGQGAEGVLIAEINENLPFMYGDAVYPLSSFNLILKGPEYNYRLFGVPKEPVPIRDHMIGLFVSTLVKDGGTLQVGIGSLCDAIIAGLNLRHVQNGLYSEIISKAGINERYGTLVNSAGGTGIFEKGLYGSSELFVDSFMELYKSGILKRKVYDNQAIMELINEDRLDPDLIPENILEMLADKEAIQLRLGENDFKMLTDFGILKDGLSFRDEKIYDGDIVYPADLRIPDNLKPVKGLLGSKLKNGQLIHAAFFLGTGSFYDQLNAMTEEERSQFGMTGVEKVNQLYGDEKLRSLQRKDGRFINTGLLANVFGAITSDKLDDGRAVSGIGGQYNFVAMAHALPDARHIMMIRSTRGEGKQLQSNIVFNYGHCSIPTHLRDLIITEYGIADVRGKSDSLVIVEMIKIADSRFQPELIKQAKKSGKLPGDFELPLEYRNNYPEKIEELLHPYRSYGLFQSFPFGTDFTHEEIILGSSLAKLKKIKEKQPLRLVAKLLAELHKKIPDGALPYLRRMKLENPMNFKERIMQKMVVLALKNDEGF